MSYLENERMAERATSDLDSIKSIIDLSNKIIESKDAEIAKLQKKVSKLKSKASRFKVLYRHLESENANAYEKAAADILENMAAGKYAGKEIREYHDPDLYTTAWKLIELGSENFAISVSIYDPGSEPVSESELPKIKELKANVSKQNLINILQCIDENESFDERDKDTIGIKWE